jgi:CubicO group peptidase (beta-lactamase class C family)
VDAARPVTAQSVLIQASVTKPLVAMAVMRLVEEGVINLDAPVTKYLPYFEMADVRYKAITVRMLLSHTAGLPAAPPTWDEPLDPAQDALAQALGYLVDKSLLFVPGTDWRYTNYGYIALGAVIAAVTGEPFESYMQRAWLVPLGMAHSTFVADEVDPAQRMAIYQSDARGEPIPAELLCDARDAPSCNLWSSCEDMVQWAKLLLNGGELQGRHFLQPQSLAAMWTAQASTGARKMYGARMGVPEAEYGLGWFLGEVAGHRLAGHTGAIPGANAQLQLAPDDGLAVIAMDNWLDRSETVAYPASSVAFDVLYLLLGVTPE